MVLRARSSCRLTLHWMGVSALLLAILICGGVNLAFLLGATNTPCTPAVKNALRASRGKIVFVSNRDGNNELYIMNTDGTHPVNLTTHPAEDRAPAISPDGKRIAFASNRTGHYQIYTMRLDGSDLINLSNNDENDGAPDIGVFYAQELKWSENGKTVIFASADGYFYSVRADGTQRKRLYSVHDLIPEPSPDNQHVAFFAEDAEAMRANGPTLWIAGSGGTTKQRVAGSKDDIPLIQGYSWSPDGKLIAYVQSGRYLTITDIPSWKARTDRETFASGYLQIPRWSADQRFLLAGYLPQVGRDLREEGYERWGLYAIDAATLHPCRLTPFAKHDDRDPVWIPAQ